MIKWFNGWVVFGMKDKDTKRDKKFVLQICDPEKRYKNSGFELRFYPHKHHFVCKYHAAGYFDCRPELEFSLGWGWLLMTLPFKTKYDDSEPPTYGIYYYESSFWLNLGNKVKAYHMPWQYDWHRTSLMLKDQTYEVSNVKNRKAFYEDIWKDKAWSGTYVYNYTMNSGKVQERFAVVTVEEMEWRQKWLKWTSKFSKVRKYINVNFSDEVGERAGDDWKGGCVSCSYSMLPKETPLAALRRMEKVRKFT